MAKFLTVQGAGVQDLTDFLLLASETREDLGRTTAGFRQRGFARCWDGSALSSCSNIRGFRGTCVSALDLSSCYCAVDVDRVIIKGLVGICTSSVWRWSSGNLILCSIPKCSSHVFTFCGSQLAAL